MPTMRAGLCLALVAWSCLLLTAACGSGTDETASGGNGPGACAQGGCDAGPGGSDGGDSTGGSTGGSTGASTGQSSGAPDSGTLSECAKVDVEAKLVKKPVDIVWVIDSSGSMKEEAAIVQQNMNAFAQTIGASGLDYHVVVMTNQGFVNVPDPLGSDAQHFLFVDEDVASKEPLEALLNRFDDYKNFLRADATTHFVAVTDDESRYKNNAALNLGATAESTRDWFQSEMKKRLGHDFILHAVASEAPKCSTAASAGKAYYLLADQTMGLKFSICSSNWTPLFTQLATAVTQSSGLSCDIPMPEPPSGKTLDKNQVNVLLAVPGAKDVTVIGRTTGMDKCQAGGWHYDNPDAPTHIVLCPSTCTDVQNQSDVAIEIRLGCQTEEVMLE